MNRNYKYMAEFAAPLMYQSGRNWLANRAITDSGILLGGIGHGINKIAKAVVGKKPVVNTQEIYDMPNKFKNLMQNRGQVLDNLDLIGNQRGIRRAGLNPNQTFVQEASTVAQPQKINDAIRNQRLTDGLDEVSKVGQRKNWVVNPVNPVERAFAYSSKRVRF